MEKKRVKESKKYILINKYNVNERVDTEDDNGGFETELNVCNIYESNDEIDIIKHMLNDMLENDNDMIEHLKKIVDTTIGNLCDEFDEINFLKDNQGFKIKIDDNYVKQFDDNHEDINKLGIEYVLYELLIQFCVSKTKQIAIELIEFAEEDSINLNLN